ncbi:MAG: hypothetical protein WCT26_05070 [Candidatus Buchananbacteria bacterium]
MVEWVKVVEDGVGVWLITPDQFEQLPDGTKLTSIVGDQVIKGRDQIDLETRGGYISFGFLEEDKPEGMVFYDSKPWVIGD